MVIILWYACLMVFKEQIIKLFEIMRIVCCALGFFVAYSTIPAIGLSWLVGLFVIPVTGLTALESLLFAKQAAAIKGREQGSDYQQQSALNNLATAVAAVVVLVGHLDVGAKIAVILVALLFFGFSSIKHIYEYFIDKKSSVHLHRFILTILLWTGSLPILFQAWP